MQRPSALLAALAALGCALTANGCQRQGEAGLHVIVAGDIERGTQFDRLDVQVYGRQSNLLSTQSFEGAELPSLPFTLNFVSGPTTPEGTEVTVMAWTFLKGVRVAQAQGRGALLPGTGGEIRLTLSPPSSLTDTGTDGGNPNPSGNCGGVVCKAVGEACTAGTQCATGFCAGGYCCNRACSGSCESCDLAGKQGQCTVHAAKAPGTPSCSPYVCDGNSGACPARCNVKADCASGFFCSEDKLCLPLRNLGEACSPTLECGQGSCVDGVCCKSACGGACDRCMAGTGECVVSTKGSAGAPSCSPYVCNGTSASCPSTCGVSADCSQPDFSCRSGACVPRLQALRDNFDDNNLGTTWPSKTEVQGTVVNAGGELRLSAGTLTGTVVQLGSNTTYDGRESYARVEIRLGAQPVSVVVSYGVGRDSSNQALFYATSGTLVAVVRSGGNDTNVSSRALDAQAMRFLQIRQTGNRTLWEYSADGKSFSELASQTNPFNMDSVGVFFGLTGTSLGGTYTAAFDNLNTP